jgi:hypothetical protein
VKAMGEPDKPPWLFYFDNKAMEGIRGLFYFHEKGQNGTGYSQNPRIRKDRQNHNKEMEKR